MLNFVRGLVDEMHDALRTIKPKPIRGFIDEICDDLRLYPEEWSICSTYEWTSSSKTYSKGGIKITHLLSKDSVMLELYNHREFEYIHLIRKEKSRLYNATLYVEKLHAEKWKKKQKIEDTENSNIISKILKSFRDP